MSYNSLLAVCVNSDAYEIGSGIAVAFDGNTLDVTLGNWS